MLSPEQRRGLAKVLFSKPEFWLKPAGADVAAAMPRPVRRLLEGEADKYEAVDGGVLGLAAAVSRTKSVPELLHAVCENQLLSSPQVDAAALRDNWLVFRGFDIDGLIRIGDANPPKDVRIARMQLREKFETHMGSAPADEHVHWGQMIDPNALWAVMTASPTVHPLYNLALVREENTHALSALQTEKVAERFQCCRYLLMKFEENDRKGDLANAVEKVIKFIGQDFPHNDMHAEMSESAERNPIRACEEVWALEASMFDKLRSPSVSVECAASLVYTLMKNSCFHRLAQNSVVSFLGFSMGLKTLDLIYQASRRDMRAELAFLSRFLSNSGAAGGGARLRIGSKDSASQVQESWKNNDFSKHVNHVVLAVKRDDVEARDLTGDLSTLRQHFVDFAAQLTRSDIEVRGVDLIGPELREQTGGTTRHLTAEHLIRPVDFLFEVRENVRNVVSAPLATDLFATFHCGEHSTNPVIGLLTFAMIVTDARFEPERDRISHALVLHDKLEEIAADQMSLDLLDLLRSRIVRNLRKRDWGPQIYLAPDSKRAALRKCLKQITDDSRDSGRAGDKSAAIRTAFAELQKLVRGFVEQGHIQIEVCVASNAMIRPRLVTCVSRHPWASQVAKGNVRVGTDDPSLTQTFPWMERAFLQLAK